MNALLIVAAGKSSRFGGFPKAFCEINGTTNAGNTAEIAGGLYDEMYIGVSDTIYDEYKDKVSGLKMFPIKTGQGDAHSLLKCLKEVKKSNSNIKMITVCWGDAVFVDKTPFSELLSKAINPHSKIFAACSYDENPYAWFEVTNEGGIIKSCFAKKYGNIDIGLHDQSLFLLDIDFAIEKLDEYRNALGIEYDNKNEYGEDKEMKLLYFFEYIHQKGYGDAECVEISKDKVRSFNTIDELNKILLIGG